MHEPQNGEPHVSQSLPIAHRFLHARRIPGGLPPRKFGELVGPFDHTTLVPEGGMRPDDNHVYFWIRVPAGPGAGALAGVFGCAFNIHSTDESDFLFTDWSEGLISKSLPAADFTPVTLSYAQLGLKDADFKPVQESGLQVLVTQYAQTCARMAAYGTIYSDGSGLHDIHLNAGEAPGSPHPDRTGQDGPLVFYFTPPAPPTARWVFIRFATQNLLV